MTSRTSTWHYASWSAAYELKHQYSAAIAAYAREIALAPNDPDGLRRAAQAHALAGDTAQARVLLDKLLHPPAGIYIPPIDPAAVYAALRDKTNCLAWLNQWCTSGAVARHEPIGQRACLRYHPERSRFSSDRPAGRSLAMNAPGE